MKKNETKQTPQKPQEEKRTEWVFIPLLKAHIFKRTDTYILFDVDGIASGIISTKFLRKKETDEMVYLSVPADYEINVNVRELVNGKWTTTTKWNIKAKDIKEKIEFYNTIG